MNRILSLSLLLLLGITHSVAQDKQSSSKPGVLTASEVKAIAPATYYYAGHAASVQLRNTVAFRTENGKNVLAGMVDTSGYSTAIAQKYQGFFINEVKLQIEGTELAPGEYGFGFMDDKFIITNVAADDVFSVTAKADDQLKRAAPLKLTEADGGYRLYAGKKYVVIKPE